MALVVVPPGMVPGPAGYPHAFPGPGMCDVGPNPETLWPDSWVEVVVLPALDDFGAPIPVRPDAAGRLLHCLWAFARPTAGLSKRRQTYPTWQPEGVGPVDPIEVESDPGVFFIGTDVTLRFTGGTVGDLYRVSVTYFTPRSEVDPDRAIDVYEDAFHVKLTSIFVTGDFTDFPDPPPYHTAFNIENGPAQIVTPIGTIPLGAVSLRKSMPLNLGQYQVKTGAFITEGAV